MSKMVEIRLHGLTCEFEPGDGSGIAPTGQFAAYTFDDPGGAVRETRIIHELPNRPVRMHKGQSLTLDREVRVILHTLEDPANPPVPKLVKFGGDLLLDLDLIRRENEWQTLHTSEITNQEPRMWRIYFGRNERIVRADISVRYAHHI